MMYVVNYKQAILIHHQEDYFVIEDIVTGVTKTIDESRFYGDCFKYPGDFERTILAEFDDKTDCIYTEEANQQIVCIMDANREGIHTPYLAVI